MQKYKIEAAACNNVGRRRKNNEDNFLLDGMYMSRSRMDEGGLFIKTSDEDAQVYAVCDGMGGMDSGEDASHAAVKAIRRFFADAAGPVAQEAVGRLISDTSSAIGAEATAKGKNSGTTLVMALANDGALTFVHVGDSRAYRLGGGELTGLTKDHSLIQRMLTMGVIDEEGAKDHKHRHVITQYLGMKPDEGVVAPTFSESIPLAAGDRYVMCSDGLTDMVPDDEIAAILAESATAMDAAAALVDRALEHGGNDNVTVICLFVRERGQPGQSEMIKRKRRLQWLVNGGIILAGAALLVTIVDALIFLSR